MIGALLKMVPTSVWIGLAVALAVGAGIWWIDDNGFDRGVALTEAKYEKRDAAQAQEIARLKLAQAKVVEVEVVKYRDRIKIVKEKGDEIVREVEKLIPVGGCELPGGFRVLHDAAVDGRMPDDPIGAAGTAEGVEAATAATTVAENYQACRGNSEQLIALQSILTKGASP